MLCSIMQSYLLIPTSRFFAFPAVLYIAVVFELRSKLIQHLTISIHIASFSWNMFEYLTLIVEMLAVVLSQALYLPEGQVRGFLVHSAVRSLAITKETSVDLLYIIGT